MRQAAIQRVAMAGMKDQNLVAGDTLPPDLDLVLDLDLDVDLAPEFLYSPHC